MYIEVQLYIYRRQDTRDILYSSLFVYNRLYSSLFVSIRFFFWSLFVSIRLRSSLFVCIRLYPSIATRRRHEAWWSMLMIHHQDSLYSMIMNHDDDSSFTQSLQHHPHSLYRRVDQGHKMDHWWCKRTIDDADGPLMMQMDHWWCRWTIDDASSRKHSTPVRKHSTLNLLESK